MNNFNYEEKGKAIEELLKDIFYIKGTSNRSKISRAACKFHHHKLVNL